MLFCFCFLHCKSMCLSQHTWYINVTVKCLPLVAGRGNAATPVSRSAWDHHRVLVRWGLFSGKCDVDNVKLKNRSYHSFKIFSNICNTFEKKKKHSNVPKQYPKPVKTFIWAVCGEKTIHIYTHTYIYVKLEIVILLNYIYSYSHNQS